MKPTDYVVLIAWSEEDNRYVSVVPDLPGCMADGTTDQEALEKARTAIQDWIEVATSLERQIPSPRDFLKLEEDTIQQQQDFQKGLQEHIQNTTREAVQTALTQIVPQIIQSILHNQETPFGHAVNRIGLDAASFWSCKGTPLTFQRHLGFAEEKV